ncbi:MAG: endopeptidase La [Oscillospiraceae bacterium]|nr:endopeptidase La [Oscillospiraceae bacterium]
MNGNKTLTLPMIALRGITVFPGMVLNFDVERPMSVKALDFAMENGRRLFLLTQKDIRKDRPGVADLYKVGTVAKLRQILRLPDGPVRVMVEGLERAKLIKLSDDAGYFEAETETLANQEAPARLSSSTEAALRHSRELFEQYASLSGNMPPESSVNILGSGDPAYVADYIAQNALVKHEDKQAILEELNPNKRIRLVNAILAREIEVLDIEHELQIKTQEQIARSQKDYVLREQMRVIKHELGETDNAASEPEEYKKKILELKLPDYAEEKLLAEAERLAKQQYGSAESNVIRNYLDVCLELPWNKYTRDRNSIKAAREQLDADHYGIEKVKERVIEFLAVRQLAPQSTGTILCFVGPPGVGKTSVAMSIAKALGRKLSRISLGGVHDEAEIRGHRKTYVGAMPGRIIAAVTQAGSCNPLILLDEIDKLGSDYRGDPSSALLEALDPEQNSTFRDHFLEMPFDLSAVLFITTANTTDTIPRPLLDRMEVIELSSYTDEEKLEIAKRHLLPRQKKRHGLKAQQLKITDTAIREIITGYTRESGVRQLERELGTLCRKRAVQIVGKEKFKALITPQDLEKLLGVKKFKDNGVSRGEETGIVNGLAWTSVGGEILEVEVNVLEGSGKLELTGNLGDVMKESARAAVSYIRSRCAALGIEPDFHKTKDIHIHFPEGAVPKDGPSAGITITTALISALTGRKVPRSVAMTGEITLRGRVLPIGGLKEKTMAAFRNGVKTVIIPKDNESDLAEIDPTVRAALTFVTAESADDVLAFLFPDKGVKEPLVPEVKAEQSSVQIRQ